NLAPAAPEIFLTLAICGVLLADVFLREEQRVVTYWLAMLALVGTAAVSAAYWAEGSVTTFAGSYVADDAASMLKMVAYLAVAIVLLYSRDHLLRSWLFQGEFSLLGLFGLLGIMVMLSAQSLLVIYRGLELLSLS